MTKRVEILKDLIFGDNTVIISKNDSNATKIMENGTLIGDVYKITAPEGISYKIYRLDGQTFVIDMENYAE